MPAEFDEKAEALGQEWIEVTHANVYRAYALYEKLEKRDHFHFNACWSNCSAVGNYLAAILRFEHWVRSMISRTYSTTPPWATKGSNAQKESTVAADDMVAVQRADIEAARSNLEKVQFSDALRESEAKAKASEEVEQRPYGWGETVLAAGWPRTPLKGDHFQARISKDYATGTRCYEYAHPRQGATLSTLPTRRGLRTRLGLQTAHM